MSDHAAELERRKLDGPGAITHNSCRWFIAFSWLIVENIKTVRLNRKHQCKGRESTKQTTPAMIMYRFHD